MMIDNRYRPVIKPSRLLVLSRRLYSPLGEEESSHAPLDEPPEIKLNPEKFAMGLKFWSPNEAMMWEDQSELLEKV